MSDKILIEPKWNLKINDSPLSIVTGPHINRTKVEFKVSYLLV